LIHVNRFSEERVVETLKTDEEPMFGGMKEVDVS
jgi:hypothetical protein